MAEYQVPRGIPLSITRISEYRVPRGIPEYFRSPELQNVTDIGLKDFTTRGMMLGHDQA